MHGSDDDNDSDNLKEVNMKCPVEDVFIQKSHLLSLVDDLLLRILKEFLPYFHISVRHIINQI